MSPLLPILLLAALPLSACTPATDAPAPTGPAPAPEATRTATEAMTPSAAALASPPVGTPDAAAPVKEGASIGGAIREGNRPPPALRICAHPLDGRVPTCIDSPIGASTYSLGVEPGRYYLMGWVQEGELALLAHAAQIRCIRAPCPPDELLEVDVAAGEEKAGIDLSGAYAEVPEGWPRRP